MAIIQEFETLRQKIVKIKHDIGSAYDYLDRGRPDEEQTQNVWWKIEAWQATEQLLMGQFKEAINNARSNHPQILGQWAQIHIGIYTAIIQDCEREYEPNRTMIFVAETAIGQWQEFIRGERDYVAENWYFMQGEQHRIQKAFKI